MHRHLVLIDAQSCNDAYHAACGHVKIYNKANHPTHKQTGKILPEFNEDKESREGKEDQLIIIDMSKDFNQNKWLGRELNDTLIFFDNNSKPNGLLAVLGCVKAGYTVFLACQVSSLSDYFKRHVFWAGLQKLSNNRQASPSAAYSFSDEMARALQLLKATQNSEEQGTVHLIGERGTGKSTLLGLLLADAIKAGKQGALLSSPMPNASRNTLSACYSGLNKKQVSRETLRYCTADKLLSLMQTAQWIVIDEAATLPRATLQAVINHAVSAHKQLILSTTIEGYEGTGQSYRLSYLHSSNRVVVLKQPKRFSDDDPLYRFCRLLYRPSATLQVKHSGSAELSHQMNQTETFHVLTTQTLRERGWTATCFSLLREAHYKTTPNDLARFYQDEALFALCIKGSEIISVAYGLPEILPDNVPTQAIFDGSRRLKNAFTQQAILHAYSRVATTVNRKNDFFRQSKILRISRIATAKTHRKQGIATRLIAHLQQLITEQHYDFLSTSFSGSADNMAFWLTQHFTPARIGLYPNKINNEYAVLMLKGLTPTAKTFQRQCVQYCQCHLHYFSDTYCPPYQVLLFSRQTCSTVITPQHILKDIESVVWGHRDINWLLPTLSNYLQQRQMTDGIYQTLCNGVMRTKKTLSDDKVLLQALHREIKSLCATIRGGGRDDRPTTQW